MSKLIRMLIPLVMGAACCSASLAQKCKSSGKPTWTESVYYVDADCAAEFRAPNHHLVIKFARNGSMSIAGRTLHLRGRRVEPPAMVSWSPRSAVFFVNDGQGSGMTSTFRFFRIKGTQIYEDKAVEKAAVSLYRRSEE